MKLPMLLMVLAQQPLAPDTPMPPGHPPMNRQPGPLPQGADLPPTPPQIPPPAPPAEAPNTATADLMKRLDQMENLKDKDKTFEVASPLGRLYYAHGRYDEARLFL